MCYACGMNVLFHHAALGDFVLTFPLIRAIGQLDAAKSWTVVAPWQKASLAAAVLDNVSPMDIEMIEFTRLFAEGGPSAMSPAVREMLAAAKRVVSFVSPGGDHWAANILPWCPQASVLFVRPRPACDFTNHVTAWHREQLRHQGLDLPEVDLAEPVLANTGESASSTNRTSLPICLHPGSGGVDKCWPIERFLELAGVLHEQGKDVRWVLGEVEVETWPAQRIETIEQTGELAVCRGTLELLEMLKTSAGYVGNDSGPTHLAAQLGLPTVALFGPSLPAQWRPIGPHVQVLAPPKPQAMDWLSVDHVRRALLN